MARSLHRRVAPDLKGLYGEARVLRDIVLGRLAAVGCEIDEKSLPGAQAIVSANIGELVATPGYEIMLGYPGGENRILTLLVQSCAAEIAVKIRPTAKKARKATPNAVRSGRWPLRLVAENGQLL
jgi:hypothetical protein